MAGRRKKKSLSNSRLEPKGSVTRRRKEKTSQRSLGVTMDSKRVSNLKRKRAQLIRGIKQARRSGQPTVSKPKEVDTSSKFSTDPDSTGSSSGTSLATPTLQGTLRVDDDGGSFYIHDMVFVKPDVMVVASTNGSVIAIDIRHRDNNIVRVLSTLQLSTSTDVSRVNDKSVMFFRRPQKVEFVTVIPKLKITKEIKLEKQYNLLRVLDKETLIGVHVEDVYNSSLEILNTKGILLKTLRPRVLNGLNFALPKYLHVTSQKHIAVVDDRMELVICFPSSGKGGFAYSGSDRYHFPSVRDIEQKDFQKEYYSLCPCCVASDSKGNVFVADSYSGLIVKVDKNGNFIQNILPLKSTEIRSYPGLQFHIDEKDHLYVSDTANRFGSIWEYEM